MYLVPLPIWLFLSWGTFRLTPVKAISFCGSILKFRPINHVAPQHSWPAYLLRGCESIECFADIPFFDASLGPRELSCGFCLHNDTIRGAKNTF